MKTVKEHYDEQLAPVYLWMVGGAESALAAGTAEIEALGLPLNAGGAVLDLGAGFGMHAIPLAKRGATVTAVDSSSELLATLSGLAGDLQIRVVEGDLVRFLKASNEQFAAILCMGDTLTHLSNEEEVRELFAQAQRILVPGGKLIVTLREYTPALEGEGRFIQVKADDTRIMTCFLDFGEGAVAVHDILHEKRAQGWQMRVSAYRKLRLAPEKLVDRLRQIGLSAHAEAGTRGMTRLVAAKQL
jgi:SAM-dependent methyltransferase